MVFSDRAYAAMEGRTKCVAKQWSGKGPAEPRNGGGALALSVELAEEHYGRAKKSIVQIINKRAN